MRLATLLFVGSIGGAAAWAELGDTLAPNLNHPAIAYDSRQPHDAVSELNRRLQQGSATLQFEPGSGYLRSVLEQLHVPIESQMAVFSKTSLQAPLIEPKNPRTIFFNDSVAVAWMRGGFIELASQDPEQGVIFHILGQQPSESPRFQRRTDCNRCHIADASLGVPGMLVHSWYPAPDGMPRLILGRFATDHRSPFEERWGGWYVTGGATALHHLGNTVFVSDDHSQAIPVSFGSGYLASTSDIAALLVFDHQMHMSNLITRIGWETRAGLHDRRDDLAATLRDAAAELVDYLLFIDEQPLPRPLQSTSGFAAQFAALGPRDSRGRTLRQLDLQHRLLRYPCSYMIYSAAFDSLPAPARLEIYQRLWQILSGAEKNARYARLSTTDRQAIIEILRDTKEDLPDYFRPAPR
jgi:hypothetical protein